MNKKILIPIIVILILAAGIGAYFYWEKIKEPTTTAIPSATTIPSATGKCGDGICDEFEKANPSLCPQDCEAQQPSTTKCGEQSGNICSSSQTCSGSWINASDTSLCCSGACQTKLPSPVGKCGDGKCEGPETKDKCPQDCK